MHSNISLIVKSLSLTTSMYLLVSFIEWNIGWPVSAFENSGGRFFLVLFTIIWFILSGFVWFKHEENHGAIWKKS